MNTTKMQIKESSHIIKNMQAILEELRLLRFEISAFSPQEKIGEYTHSSRIKQSYKKALAKHPLTSSWK